MSEYWLVTGPPSTTSSKSILYFFKSINKKIYYTQTSVGNRGRSLDKYMQSASILKQGKQFVL